MADQSNIQSAASKSIRPFKSSEEYLYAMKEDLAEWLNTLYDLDILADTFMEGLETGCALCQHANNVNRAALDFQLEYPEVAKSMRMPSKDVVFQSRNVVPGSFLARDNVSNFIGWCRQELCIKDVLMFETNDLVQKRNEKNFVLCLLEVARRGAKFGMLAPMLIQLEEEIEEEIRDQENLGEASPPSIGFSRMESARDPTPGLYPNWQQKRVLCDMRNLDELVREILGGCSCPSQFPMTKVSEGKYKVGDSSALIFIRVLRTHVMVRVGGGWDTLEHYLDKHDPCRCTAFAHRYQQSKSGGQGPHSKSSSTHSSRSTSPGPHWRNEAMGPFKTPDKRSLEPLAPASSRPGRGHRPSLPVELDANTAGTATLIPRPPRDHSEPRPLHPLRSKDTALPATRKLSGDSDSSTASSKGGGGGGAVRVSGGGTRRLGEEVVLLVNRKEGKHVIERARREGRIPSLQPPQARARSHSRERPMAAALKPSPPQGGPDGSWSIRSERGRSLGPEGPRRLQAPRSHSQGKIPSRSRVSEASPGPRPHIRDPQPPHSDRREDRRTKQAPQASPKLSGGGFPRRQMASSNSLGKGGLHSPSKKAVATPRPPAPRSPSMGGRRLLPPVSQPGRHSPLSSPHSSPRSPRATRASRSTGLGRLGRGSFECQEPEDEGRSFPVHLLPSLDPQKEHELYRSFEAEFLANARLAGGGSSREAKGKDLGGLHLPPPQQQEQGFRGLLPAAPGEGNTTDSAYSSSSSSSSSINVGVKVGVLPDLHESRRVSPRCCPIEDASLESQTSTVPHNDSHLMSGHWGSHGAPYRKLPALSNSPQDRELLASLRDPDLLASKGHIFTKPGLNSMDINDGPGAASLQQQSFVQATEVLMDGRQARLEWTRGEEVQGQQDHHLSFPYDLSDELDTDLPDGTLHPADPCPSPLPLPPSEDCSFKDSSSESSSMCISLSETHSEGGSPPPPSANGDLGVVLRPKKGLKKPDRVPSIYKLKLRPKIRPRTENRPENSPSRIPTPVSYREQQKSASNTPPHSPQTNGRLRSRKDLHRGLAGLLNPRAPSPGTGQRDGCSSVESGSLDDEAWM